MSPNISIDAKKGLLYFDVDADHESKPYAMDDLLDAPLFWLRSIEREQWGSRSQAMKAYQIAQTWRTHYPKRTTLNDIRGSL